MAKSKSHLDGITRRDSLRMGGGLLLGAGMSVLQPRFLNAQQAIETTAPPANASPTRRRRTLRVAHLTDMHVKPERGADRGLTQCLHHVQGLKDPPQLILNGGDALMDVLMVDRRRADELASLWQRIFRDECSIPVRNCVGNHDVWGWDKQKSGTSGNETDWGLKWTLAQFKLERPFYSFDEAGWHFVVLNSVFPDDAWLYKAWMGQEQIEWLADDLKRIDPGTPVLVLSHIPILSVAIFFWGDYGQSGNWQLPGSLIHTDTHKLKALFDQHKNVKLCLSGHLHLVDHVSYSGVSYICDGAVSGSWWGGNMHEFEEGYGLIDLYDDGTFEHQYVAYGWTVPAE